MTVFAQKKDPTKTRKYHGPCRSPHCKRDAISRGVCQRCYEEIRSKSSHNRRVATIMLRVGILLPREFDESFAVPGISIGVRHSRWLPTVSREGFGTQNRETTAIRDNKTITWESEMERLTKVSWDAYPEAAKLYRKFSRSELKELAKLPTKWSPGTPEKQFMFHIREIFSLPHFVRGDNREAGTGTVVTRMTGSCTKETSFEW